MFTIAFSTGLVAADAARPYRRKEIDLLDTFCYGIALAIGNSEGFWFNSVPHGWRDSGAG
jgi:hypothetical protein